MPQFRGITYSDYQPDGGGCNIQLAIDATRVERMIQVDWTDLYNTYQKWLGFSYVVDIGGGLKVIRRQVPHAIALPGQTAAIIALAAELGLPDLDEEMLASEWLFATGVIRTEGVGPRGVDAEGWPNYEMARITFQYTSPPYRLLADDHADIQGSGDYAGQPDEALLTRYIRKLYKPTQRAITIPRALCRWTLLQGDRFTGPGTASYAPSDYSDAGPAILESLAKAEQGIDLVYVHMQRPDLPLTQIMNCMGKVNSSTFDGVFPAGTLLCETPEITPETSPLGQLTWNVAFRFKFLAKNRLTPTATSVGHNWFLRHFPRSDDGGATEEMVLDYREVTSSGFKVDANDVLVFQEADFATLFRPV